MVATLVSVHPLVYSKLEQPSSRLTGMLAAKCTIARHEISFHFAVAIHKAVLNTQF